MKIELTSPNGGMTLAVVGADSWLGESIKEAAEERDCVQLDSELVGRYIDAMIPKRNKLQEEARAHILARPALSDQKAIDEWFAKYYDYTIAIRHLDNKFGQLHLLSSIACTIEDGESDFTDMWALFEEEEE